MSPKKKRKQDEVSISSTQAQYSSPYYSSHYKLKIHPFLLAHLGVKYG